MRLRISYYSDVLCIWAYAGQRRLDQLVRDYGDKIVIETRFCSVFPDARGKIESTWKSKGGYAGFNHHLNEVAQKFPHVEVDKRLCLETRPRTSASPHLFLKAVEIIESTPFGGDSTAIPYAERPSTHAAWALRRAFFAAAKDISDWQVHGEIAAELGIDYTLIEQKIRSSEAVALLASDYDLSQKRGIEGSPTYLMNNGRQKLFGNVGYRLLEANVQELLHNPSLDDASWC
ncbi:MAG: DsbA family protein [Halocynthiibacter sp.]